MNTMKILLVEDEKDQQDIFEHSIEVFNDKNALNVECEIVADVQYALDKMDDALDKMDGSFDGAIIDLRLGDNDEGGNEIVQQLGGSFTRIPIIFVTASPDLVNEHPSVIKTRSRADATYESDLLLFRDIYNTGLSRIMGGRGLIEQRLSEVFLENLLPQIQTWVSYRTKNSERTEKALLRYTLNHLLQLLEENEQPCFPEEVYLYPPVLDEVTTKSKLTTGSIVKENNQWFVVLSPACDLITRGGGQFTERILSVEVEKETDVVDKALNRLGRITDEVEKEKVREDILQKLSRNNYTFYYHWFPPVKFNLSDGGSLDFDGGFLNFRKLETLSKKKFNTKFGDPLIQISPFFVKDIVSRFSSYYARQGQPDIDSDDFVTRYTT